MKLLLIYYEEFSNWDANFLGFPLTDLSMFLFWEL